MVPLLYLDGSFPGICMSHYHIVADVYIWSQVTRIKCWVRHADSVQSRQMCFCYTMRTRHDFVLWIWCAFLQFHLCFAGCFVGLWEYLWVLDWRENGTPSNIYINWFSSNKLQLTVFSVADGHHVFSVADVVQFIYVYICMGQFLGLPSQFQHFMSVSPHL